MEKKVSLRLTVFLILLVAVMTFMATFVGTAAWLRHPASPASSAYKDDYTALEEVKKYFEDYYVGEFDEDKISEYIIAGFVAGTGDKYASYYNKENFELLKEDLNGEMQGIGVSVIYNADYQAIEIIDVFPDSPAMDAGVETGDLVVYVGEERESVASLGYYGALEKLRGLAGTTAVFTVFRGENYENEIPFTVERGYIIEQTVTFKISELDKSVGIVKISSFDTETVNQFKNAVETLCENGAQKLIFDVRNNPGGELNSICKILDYLLPEGPVVRASDKSGDEKVLYDSDPEELDMPMAVLTNSNTASAAELFSSALKDYKKATLVGTLTYGKGCMQTILPLHSGGGLSLTTAMYYPPFSDNYDGIGVTPDVEAELSEEAQKINLYKLAESDDDQLKAAIEVLNK